jgi:hypothetical protein
MANEIHDRAHQGQADGRYLLPPLSKLRAAGPPHLSRLTNSPHELVERALATAITAEPDAPQDFDARKVRIVAQPLPRGCGADVTSLELEPPIRQDSTANPIPESNSSKISSFCGAGQSSPGEFLTEPIILEAVPLLSGFRKKSVVRGKPTWRSRHRPARVHGVGETLPAEANSCVRAPDPRRPDGLLLLLFFDGVQALAAAAPNGVHVVQRPVGARHPHSGVQRGS